MGWKWDFVIDLEGVRWLVEVKASRGADAGDTDSLQRASAYFPRRARRLLVHLGGAEKSFATLPALPWQRALREMGL